MPSIVANAAVENCLRACLSSEGYDLSRRRGQGETGVDIIACKNGKTFHIEVIGYKKQPPLRSKDFFEGFFRTLSRLKENPRNCIFAMSHLYGRGLRQRVRHYGVGWARIGNAFPELQISLVNTEEKIYTTHSWGEWLLGSQYKEPE